MYIRFPLELRARSIYSSVVEYLPQVCKVPGLMPKTRTAADGQTEKKRVRSTTPHMAEIYLK